MTEIPVIPDHTLRRPIGKGAYGEVWLARNVMGAPRAVKIVWRRQFDSDRPYEREFAGIQRYEPVSRSADGLVHVLHVGRNDADGYFYYVMELADGVEPSSDEPTTPNTITDGSCQEPVELTPLIAYTPRTLRSDLRRLGRLPIADCLRAALGVVAGLARLHERGLVHRDVKPGNIIFVDGHAKLADIGLVSNESEGRTYVGTEGYIPPEGPGSPAADLYALGMVLYEAATGYPPDRFPKVPPDWFAEEAGAELLEFHEVVLKACEGAKERRYRSAEEMQADLALLQSGQSVRHLRALEERVNRWRHIGLVAAMVVTVAVFAALIANWRARVASESQAKETRLKEQAQASLARAETAERDARRQLNSALFEQARAIVVSKEVGHRIRALDALKRATGATNTAEMRRVAFAALALPDLEPEFQLRFETSIATYPDPKLERIALCSGVGPVRLCRIPSLEEIVTLPAVTNREAYYVIWSPNGRHLAVRRAVDNTRALWEIWEIDKEPRRIIVTANTTAYFCISFHPSKPRLLTGYAGGRVVEWDLETGKESRSFTVPSTPHAVAYSPDGSRLASSYREGTNRVIAIHETGEFGVERKIDWPEPVEFIVWDPRGQWFTMQAANASIWARGVRLIEAATGNVRTLGEHKVKTAAAAFTADGDYLITSGWDRQTICWDLRSGQPSFTFNGTGYRSHWSTDGQHCAIEHLDSRIQFFTFQRPIHRVLPGNSGDVVHSGAISPDGTWLTTRDDRDLYLWNLKNTAPATRVPIRHRIPVFFSPDSTEIFAIPSDPTERNHLGRWRLSPGSTPDAPPRFESLPMQLPRVMNRAAVAANNLIVTSPDVVHILPLTNLASGLSRQVSVPPSLGGFVSPDGRWLAMIYNFSPLVRVFRLPEVEEAAVLTTSNFVMSVSFSPNGDEIVVINRSGAEWFSTTNWSAIHRLAGPPVAGSYALYTPDGSGIWMVTQFRNAALLDRRTLEPRLPLPNDMIPLAISSDGRSLAVSVEGRRVQMWDMNIVRQEFAKLGLDWGDAGN